MIEARFLEMIAAEVGAGTAQVAAAVELLDRGGAVAFIAHYRKDATGGLDERRLETIEQRNLQFTALSNRRDAARANVDTLGRMTESLSAALEACSDPLTLEDLYLPFKKQKHTKAALAAQRGLEPFADYLWVQIPHPGPVEFVVEQYVCPERQVLSVEEALEGARHIVAERIASDAEVRRMVRAALRGRALFTATATKYLGAQRDRYTAYFDYAKPLGKVGATDLLAVMRGMKIGVLRVELVLEEEPVLAAITARFVKDPESSFAPEITAAAHDAYRRLLRVELEEQVLAEARRAADEALVRELRGQVEAALMSQPAGPVPVLAVHAEREGGASLAALDAQGGVLETATAVNGPESAENSLESILPALLERHGIGIVAVGNSGAGRQTGRKVQNMLRGRRGRSAHLLHVPEAGLSAYAQSPLAEKELPEMETALRAAVSLGRRCQDPLFEMIKIEPRALAVGPHTREVNQRLLQEALFRTVEYCVCRVGVDLNAAPVHALRYVCGMQMGAAQNLAAEREKNGGFKNRAQLLSVSGIGEKTQHHCAGFLRVTGGDQPLDATRIHPEAYEAVGAALAAAGLDSAALPSGGTVDSLDFSGAASPFFGERTQADWRRELAEPWTDPRGRYQAPAPRPRRQEPDLAAVQEGAVVEGKITNIASFGVFVDFGAGKEGLIHLSELAAGFVRDANEVVKVGDVVKARVMRVDAESRRISLSIRALLPPPEHITQDDAGQRGGGQRTGLRDAREPRRDGPQEDRQGGRRRPASADGRDRHRDNAPDKRRMPSRSSEQQSAPSRSSGGELMNTLLSDQLAALRDKLLSE